ncbi:hypothetical protein D3C87_1100210 [compost metagenome]|jgi:hypothetical protein|uniref:Transmembrane protein n=2 Tax=Rhizobium/Agrobacterium group TaxID=227290 RepID=A0AA44FCZ2_AGRTU|nr:hypothetical protein AGROH133_10414 [Agrobacterium tumefaciens]MBO9110130.1 hypothetical protein [Agrobacterium sp. S2/73]QXZ74071.1 hypothetical protein J5276_15875 [Agrobacterium sp. S7/73]KAA3525087.1 hypothetical protein DXM29_18465 [Agrobacterium tumefaciens]NSL20040.1 hypothetical protein [Agrobacterium tumefaciens]
MNGAKKTLMDNKVFSDLVAAYGADPQRWPEDRRPEAMAYAETADGRRLIAQAAPLDFTLSAYRLRDPSAMLNAKIMAQAKAQTTRRRWIVRYGLGAGMIGISLAGALTGAVAVINLTPPPALTLGDTLTAFGNLQTENEMTEETK